jgi:hypothetical protein
MALRHGEGGFMEIGGGNQMLLHEGGGGGGGLVFQ